MHVSLKFYGNFKQKSVSHLKNAVEDWETNICSYTIIKYRQQY